MWQKVTTQWKNDENVNLCDKRSQHSEKRHQNLNLCGKK